MRTQKKRTIRELKRLAHCDSAISTVVSAVLLLAIVVSVITVVNVQYVPEWKTSAEQVHMDDVFYDMAEMKNELDILSAYTLTEPSTSLSVSVPIKMGGASIPIFSSGKSSGRLAINDEEFDMDIVATKPGIDYGSGPILLDLGSVTYESANNYFVDQVLTYENGALILSQNDHSLMRLDPQISMKRTENASNITMYVNAVDLDGSTRSISSSSVEELNFRTNGSDSLYGDGMLFTDATLTLRTSYPSSWVNFFETMADDAGIDPAEYTITYNDSMVVFLLEGSSGEDIKLDVTKSIFDVGLNLIS